MSSAPLGHMLSTLFVNMRQVRSRYLHHQMIMIRLSRGRLAITNMSGLYMDWDWEVASFFRNQTDLLFPHAINSHQSIQSTITVPVVCPC